MSKKPKNRINKNNKSVKYIKKGGKRGKGIAASAIKGALKGEVLRVMRTHGFVRESNSGAEYFISGRDLLGAIPNDVVLFEKVPLSKQTKHAKDGDSLPQAKVVKVIKSSQRLLTGTAVDEEGVLCLIPDSFGSRYPLDIGSWNGYKLKAGDKVSFTLKSRGNKHHLHVANITGVYGSSQSARVCVNAYLEEKGIVTDANDVSVFPDEVEAEALSCGNTIGTAEIAKRLDLRHMPIFTIDGEDTKDIDDAISIEKTNSGYMLGVHIADVSYYVTAESALNEEAFKRGTSVYIADMVVPMLPKALSNGICSLNPNVDRLAFSCLMQVAKSGELKSFEFKKTVIRSRIQGVYSEINAIIQGETRFNEKYSEVIAQIPVMNELASVLKKNREGRYAPALESAECKIVCSQEGACLDIRRRESGENAISEGIIEEFMLLANNAAARLAMENDFPFVYRVHEPPAAEKLLRLTDTLAGLGITIPELKPTAESLFKVLEQVKNERSERIQNKFDVVNMAVLRAMMKAKYSEEPLGHFGLVMKEYAHFTSPIRRYPDLSIHRVLSDYVTYGQGRLKKKYSKFVHESALKSSNTELRAVNAERDCNKFYFAEYMSPRIDEEFDGTISGVTEISVYVMLENTVEGRVMLADDGYYESDSVSIFNDVTGVKYTLGDKVRVKCIGCSVPMGTVDFEVVWH